MMISRPWTESPSYLCYVFLARWYVSARRSIHSICRSRIIIIEGNRKTFDFLATSKVWLLFEIEIDFNAHRSTSLFGILPIQNFTSTSLELKNKSTQLPSILQGSQSFFLIFSSTANAIIQRDWNNLFPPSIESGAHANEMNWNRFFRGKASSRRSPDFITKLIAPRVVKLLEAPWFVIFAREIPLKIALGWCEKQTQR